MSKCIVVLGIHSSGTSAVAGCLHTLGVNMGDKFLKSDHWYPKGFYEDQEFLDVHRHMIDGSDGLWYWTNPKFSNYEYLIPEYQQLIDKKCQQELWGVKDPKMCYIFPLFYNVIRSSIKTKLFVVNVKRPLLDSARSLVRKKTNNENLIPMTFDETLTLCEKYQTAKRNSLSLCNDNVFDLTYNDLIAQPRKILSDLCDFTGIKRKYLSAACSTVNHKLRHFNNERAPDPPQQTKTPKTPIKLM